jgi:hypothetical protein
MLRPVWYGKEMGQETVNGVAARHYAIDASSLGQGPSEVSGDVWIADPGAFVVRYELRIKADEAYFGKGTKGEQTTVYELKDIGAKKEMALPAGCPPPVSDLPAMPDAADLVRGPFALTYTTASGMAKTVSFYQEKMKALGWILESSADESFKDRWLLFALAKDKEHAFVTLRPEGAQVRVEVRIVQD